MCEAASGCSSMLAAAAAHDPHGTSGRQGVAWERAWAFWRTLASGESLKDAFTLMNMPLDTPNLRAFFNARSFCGRAEKNSERR